MSERHTKGRRSSRDVAKDHSLDRRHDTEEETRLSDSQGDLFSSQTSATQSSRTGASSSGGPKSSMFDVATLAELPNMTNDQLKRLESQIQNEFSQLSREYLKARLLRVNYMVDTLATHVDEFRKNDQSWNADFEEGRSQIESLKNVQEQKCLHDESIRSRRHTQDSSDETAAKINRLMEDYGTPFKYDKYLYRDSANTTSLPFKANFDKIVKGYSNDLNSILNEHLYYSKLLEKKIEDNRKIIWLEYRSSLIDSKNTLIDKHLHELNMLQDMEERILTRGKQGMKSRQIISNWEKYHNSTNKINAKLENKDTRRYESSKLSHTNRIELTNIKRYNLDNLNKFARSQNGRPLDTINPSKRVKLSACAGLTDDEISNDLLMLRNNVHILGTSGAGSSVSAQYFDQPDNDDDDIDVNDPSTPQSDAAQTDYNKLLNLMNTETTKLPELPSLEKFVN